MINLDINNYDLNSIDENSNDPDLNYEASYSDDFESANQDELVAGGPSIGSSDRSTNRRMMEENKK